MPTIDVTEINPPYYRVIRVWEPATRDTEGQPTSAASYTVFADRKDAHFLSDGGLDPFEHAAIELGDGTVRVLGKPVHLNTDVADFKRQTALAKLTPSERRLLGLS